MSRGKQPRPPSKAPNPLALRVVEKDRVERAQAAFTLPPSLVAAPPNDGVAHPRISVLRASFAEHASWEDRLDWMEDLAAFCGERLLRVKGFLRRPGDEVPLLVQAVGTLFSPAMPMPSAKEATEGLVVIARDLGAAELRSGLPTALVRIAAWRKGAPLVCSLV